MSAPRSSSFPSAGRRSGVSVSLPVPREPRRARDDPSSIYLPLTAIVFVEVVSPLAFSRPRGAHLEHEKFETLTHNGPLCREPPSCAVTINWLTCAHRLRTKSETQPLTFRSESRARVDAHTHTHTESMQTVGFSARRVSVSIGPRRRE